RSDLAGWGLHPLEKRRLITAHTTSRHSHRSIAAVQTRESGQSTRPGRSRRRGGGTSQRCGTITDMTPASWSRISRRDDNLTTGSLCSAMAVCGERIEIDILGDLMGIAWVYTETRNRTETGVG